MADKKPTDEELSDWPTVREANLRAAAHFKALDVSGTVWARVRTGHIRAYARRWSHWTGQYGTPTPVNAPRLITPADWRAFEGSVPGDFWKGEATWGRRPDGAYGSEAYTWVACIDIRFDPIDVDREFPEPSNAARVAPSAPAVEEDQAEDAPPVEREDLEAWYALYIKLYPEERPLPHAVASAKGFFRDKTVGRDRVHALFSARKSGRKGSPAKK